MIDQTTAAAQPIATPTNGLKFTLEEVPSSNISIQVIGVGGCGGNVIDDMIEAGIGGVDFTCLNTDEQALQRSKAGIKIQLGSRVTQGYGTGSSPTVGREAALENTDQLTDVLSDADMVFLIAGLGGGTGTGAMPVVASLAKQLSTLTVAAVIKPFAFEGKRRAQTAEEGLETLLEQVDAALVIPNEQLLEHVEAGSGFLDGCRIANGIIGQALQGITDVLTRPGIINCDFADIRAVLQDAGVCVVSSSERSGRDAATQAARDALENSMMEHDGLGKAGKLLVNITGSNQFGIHDAHEALQLIQRDVGVGVEMIFGTVHDDSMGDRVKVMVIASSFQAENFRLEPQEEMPAAAEEGFAEAEAAWSADAPMELLDPGLQEVHAVADVGTETTGAEPNDGRDQAELPSAGRPVDFVTPPNIRVDEDDEEDLDLEKPAFFRRRSLFR